MVACSDADRRLKPLVLAKHAGHICHHMKQRRADGAFLRRLAGVAVPVSGRRHGGWCGGFHRVLSFAGRNRPERVRISGLWPICITVHIVRGRNREENLDGLRKLVKMLGVRIARRVARGRRGEH